MGTSYTCGVFSYCSEVARVFLMLALRALRVEAWMQGAEQLQTREGVRDSEEGHAFPGFEKALEMFAHSTRECIGKAQEVSVHMTSM